MRAETWAAVGGASVLGFVGVYALLAREKRGPHALAGAASDEEAIARMLASENPAGGEALWLEQIWTQIRSAGRSSLWRQITAGAGYGPESHGRPVSTASEATPATRSYAARFLAELPASSLPGARRFFEPGQQDRAFQVAEGARRKQASGQPLTSQERRLLGYKSDAAGIRERWRRKGLRYVGTVGGVEFWT